MAGLEPATFALAARRSDQLSYIPIDIQKGRRGSNPRHPAWKAGALPLSYSPAMADGSAQDLPPGIEPGPCRICNPMPSHLATGGGDSCPGGTRTPNARIFNPPLYR